MKLNNYQKIALDNISIFEKKGLNKGTAVLPVGTGKTFLAVNFFLKKITENPKVKLLYICHNKDILKQAEVEEFSEIFSDFDIGYFISDKKDINQLTFASVQTLYRNLDNLDCDLFDYIVVDEAHHYQARTYKKVVKHFNSKFMLSLTATPFRNDNKDVYKLMGNPLIEKQLRDAINDDMLCGINYWCVDKDIDFSNIKTKYNGEYDKTDLNKKLFISKYDEAILDEYNKIIIEKFNRNKTICFCSTRKHAKRMATFFNKKGIKSCYLTGDLPRDKRNKNIFGFKEGDYKVIFVVDLFNEGINVPNCDSVIFLRSTSSKNIFIQQLGRGLRKFKNKDDVLILDFTGNSKNNTISFEILSNIVEKDIISEIKKDKIKYSNREEFEFNGNIKIRLNSYKLEYLSFKSITKQDCIDEYFKVKKELGKKPKITNLKISQHIFNRLFGGYKKFLIEINENKNITKQDCIDEYFRLKKELGKKPLFSELNINQYIFNKLFGSYNNFLNEIGEDRNITKQDCIVEYFKVKKELNRKPMQEDFVLKKGSIMTKGDIIKLFGSYNNFLNEIGETISKQDCIDEYFRLKKELNKIPSQLDLVISNGAKISTSKIISIFGSWDNFLNEVGYNKNITKQDCIDEYFRLKKKLGRKPIQIDFILSNGAKITIFKIKKLFGSFSNFLNEVKCLEK